MIMRIENPEVYGPEGDSRLTNELTRLEEKRVAAELGSQAVRAVGVVEKTRTDELYEEGVQAWENWDQYANRPA